MKSIRDLVKRKKRFLAVSTIIVASVIPIAAVDNYFEVSKNLEILTNIYKDLNLYYVDEIDPNTLMRTGIDAMLNSLDPFTNYISEAEMEGYRLQTTGKYGGIGAMIKQRNDYIAIVEPYKNSPAYKAGLLAGDIVLEINGHSTRNKTVEEVSNLLKGQPGSEINLLVKRPDIFEERLFTMEREDIVMESVSYSGMVNENIGYIKLDQFTDKSGRNVANALKDLKKDNDLKGIILDLRGNPGGLLHEAVNVSNVFVDKNKLVVSTKGKVVDQDYKTLNEALDPNIPVTVLINRTSASASEIVAGVIQDYDRGVIIGQRSYGKGLVQQTRDISYKTKLKLTTAKYYMPSGRCIQAIDYSLRYDEGAVTKIPDSLKNPFKTTGGRTVYDGGGIEPDAYLEPQSLANISVSLLSKDLIFDYATIFRNKNSNIAEPKNFKLSDSEYDAFVAFLSDKEYDYKTNTEVLLAELESKAKNEKYYDAVASDIADLKKNIKHDKEKDLYKFRNEIQEILENEIVSRYYAQSGRIEASFNDDPEILEAVNILSNDATYKKYLKTGR